MPDPSKSILEGAIAPWGIPKGKRQADQLQRLSRNLSFNPSTPFSKLSKTVKERSSEEKLASYPTSSTNTKRLHPTKRGKKSSVLCAGQTCPDCRGACLRPEALAVTISNCTIADIASMPIAKIGHFFQTLDLKNNAAEIAAPSYAKSKTASHFSPMSAWGISRSTAEPQRFQEVNFSAFASPHKSEPASSGPLRTRRTQHWPAPPRQSQTHQHLLQSARFGQLGHRGRTRPRSHRNGRSSHRPGTGRGRTRRQNYLTGTARNRDRRRKFSHRQLSLRVEKPSPSPRHSPASRASLNQERQRTQLAKRRYRYSTGCLCMRHRRIRLGQKLAHQSHPVSRARPATPPRQHITTTSQSHRRHEQIDKVIRIDQSPIGRTPRSNAATYTGLFTAIRELYAQLPESQSARLWRRALQLQHQRRALRSLPGRWRAPHRNALPPRRIRHLRHLRRQPIQQRNPRNPIQRQFNCRRTKPHSKSCPHLLPQHPGGTATTQITRRCGPGLSPPRSTGHIAFRRRGTARQTRNRTGANRHGQNALPPRRTHHGLAL